MSAQPSSGPLPQTPAEAALAVEVATTKESVKGLSEDFHDLGRRVGNIESEMRKGFSAVAEQVGKVALDFRTEAIRAQSPKGIEWKGVSAMLAIAFALASWANSYFGKDISALAKENVNVSERISVLSNRIHEESIRSARSAGANEADAKWNALEAKRLNDEIDRLRAAGKTP